MKRKVQNKIFTAIVFMALAFGALQSATWISQMAFDNTCIELQEQYIGTQVSEIIGTIENAVNFGKELKNYYGINEVLSQVCHLSKGNLKACILDDDGEMLYLSFERNKKNLKLFSEIYGENCQKEIAAVTQESMTGETIGVAGQSALVFPIFRNHEELVGHFLVLYQKEELLARIDFSSSEHMKWIVWGVISVCLLLFFLIKKEKDWQGGYVRYVPAVFIMLGMFLYILFMLQVYRTEYSVLVGRNAQSAAMYLRDSVEALIEKGLPIDRIEEVSDYLNRKARSNASVESIAVVRNYFHTQSPAFGNFSMVSLPMADDMAELNVVVSQSYIRGKILLMTLTFGAVFIICLMVTYEMTQLAKMISVRACSGVNQEMNEHSGDMGGQVKLLAFLSYMAIYTSMSYTAVIMRNQDVSLFGMSKAVSASLPLTVELLCIMLCSAVVQKVFQRMKLHYLMLLAFLFLILGNAACATASSPYILLGLRAFCGMGFGLLKYWLNSIVAAGSVDSAAVGENYAKLNAGLLGGITAGASLGAVLAQSMGYQFNYLFTGGVCLFVIVLSGVVMPWKMLNAGREHSARRIGNQSVRILDVLRNKTVRKAIFLGDIPLNVGLMYVVAFVPVYMDHVGQPTVAVSYAYLVNGLAGVYLGAVFLRLLKNLSAKAACVTALLTGAVGILALVIDSCIGMILLSAGIMGIFDGYGTPVVTRFFTDLPQVRRADTASMLTVFNSVGSAVQILCPMLYNMLIQPDGSTWYLLVFGGIYTASAMLFFVSFSRDEFAGQAEEKAGAQDR